MSLTIKLNDWWYDCGYFQALQLPCHHIIVVYFFSHIDLTTYIHLVYNLYTINKAYELQFHSVKNIDYWSTYTGPNFIPDPNICRRTPKRPPTTRIHITRAIVPIVVFAMSSFSMSYIMKFLSSL